MESRTRRVSPQVESKAASKALMIIAIALSILFVLGVVGCIQQALAHGYVLGFQFDSCFALFMFVAIAMLASCLANDDASCVVLRRCAIASIALAATCLIGVALYYVICKAPGSHSGDISLSIPCGILISGAILAMLYLLFRRFIRMKEDLEDFV